MAAPQSLFNLWMESSFIDNKGWLVDYLKRLNPTVSKIKGFVNEQTGVWDFSFADMVASSVPCEISYRPYSIYENDYWKQMPAKQFVAMVKSRLQGRKYRVNVGCEPSPNANDLAAVLKWTVELMQEGDVQGVDFDVLSIPVQYLTMFTNDPRDISKGMWKELARVAGFLRGKMRIVYHMYTGLVLPAGTFDDSYLREIAHKRELLQQPYTWANYEQITDPTNLQRYRTRHLFRHKWLNYYALEQGFQEHDYYIGEAGWDWFGGEWDLGDTWARTNGIAGSDLDICLPDKRFVSGIRTLANFWRWKFPQWTFKEAAVNQLTWLGAQLAKDPRCKGWAYYAYTFKEGDQQPYNLGVYKDVLEGMIGANMVNVATPPPVDDEPDVPPSEPLTLEQQVALLTDLVNQHGVNIKELQATVAQLTGDHR